MLSDEILHDTTCFLKQVQQVICFSFTHTAWEILVMVPKTEAVYTDLKCT